MAVAPRLHLKETLAGEEGDWVFDLRKRRENRPSKREIGGKMETQYRGTSPE